MPEEQLDGGPESEEGVLRVKGLKTYVYQSKGTVKAVDGVDLTVRRGEAVALVGESGSGKTMTALSVMRLMPVSAARIIEGEIWFDGKNLVAESESSMRKIRGRRISLIMQDPLTALNPVLTVGDQVGEPIRYHLDLPKKARLERVLEVLKSVRIPRPSERVSDYPHQFSGGMRQRIVAAMALGTSPALIIADEPTTALDVTIQAQVLALLKEIQQERNMSMLWVSHDLGTVAQTCDRVNVMYAGRIVESGAVRRIFRNPLHPYTVALMKSVPSIGDKRDRLYQIDGRPPDLADLPPGCRFYDRCPERMDICQNHYPPATSDGDDGVVHCWARMPADKQVPPEPTSEGKSGDRGLEVA